MLVGRTAQAMYTYLHARNCTDMLQPSSQDILTCMVHVNVVLPSCSAPSPVLTPAVAANNAEHHTPYVCKN
jgi:hypothetical protein